tara:strand:+ start:2897 stop:3721 length:825 start_codon:yes stop_codon:yes gene_type:complete
MTSQSQDNLSESDSPSTSSKRYTLLEIQYDGTDYHGWQIQPGLPTVQGKIREALTKLNHGVEPSILGSGRTDSGVHALNQYAKVTWESDIAHEKIIRALNGTLPRDIRIVSAIDVERGFHPVRDASSKTYRYYFSAGRVAPVLARFVYEHRYDLDIEKMKSAAKVFEGEHDFEYFRTLGTPVNSTVRKIFESTIRPASELTYDEKNPIWVYEVSGSGFLKQMVRLMVSSLFQVGRDKASIDDVRAVLSKSVKKRLGAVAPPQGLVLYKVVYPVL